MPFNINITQEAQSNIQSAYLWILERDAKAAEKWLNGLDIAIRSLQNMPQRCVLAPESSSFEQPIRQLLHGRSRRKYRVLFTIQDDQVTILYCRHYRQDHL